MTNSVPANSMITILGPTATGKTKLAAHLALKLHGEIISADSRQIYKRMNIGTGKDYKDFVINKKPIPYHLIDVLEPGRQYNVFRYQQDFIKIYSKLIQENKTPILCGGSGLYLEAILNGYQLLPVAPNKDLQNKLSLKSHEELITQLKSLKPVHNVSDLDTKKRTIRAIEIALYAKKYPNKNIDFPSINNTVFGIHFEREIIRKRITKRLEDRLKNGMVEEVENLMKEGLTKEQLTYYGLEYKFITGYLCKECTYDEMKQKLNTAIHQFAKRQMTWFRRMERNGIIINWLDGNLNMKEKLATATKLIKSNKKIRKQS